MDNKIDEIRNNPELIEEYLLEEDLEEVRQQGYRNFVDCCDDDTIKSIMEQIKDNKPKNTI